jgi:hypothetical protein
MNRDHPVDDIGNRLRKGYMYVMPDDQVNDPVEFISEEPYENNPGSIKMNFFFYFLPKHQLQRMGLTPAVISRPWVIGEGITINLHRDEDGDTDIEDDVSIGGFAGGFMLNKKNKTTRRRNKNKTKRRRNKNKTKRRGNKNKTTRRKKT